jgi:hypothetical protein
VGTVTVNGTPAASGTLIEARIGNSACGSSAVFIENGQSRYALDSPALDPVNNPGCGTDGSTVVFYVGGQKADQTAPWVNFQLNTLNLTVVPATVTPVGPTPAPPATGDGPTNGSNGSTSLIGLMLVSAMLGLGGVAIASRVRNQ